MRATILFVSLLLFAAACDRRDDPDVPPESQGVNNPPGETVGSAEGSMEAHHPPESALDATTPADLPASCEGLTGGQLAKCIREDAGEDGRPAKVEEPTR